jgi:5-methylcytosine-specific restriction endonuclease McrA
MTITKSINVCLHCEKTFEAGKKTARFCSSECRRTIIRACLVCGDDFKTRRDGKIMTCSDECRSTQNKWPMKRSQKQCEMCKKQFTVKHVRFSRTCGRQCAAKLRMKECANSIVWVPTTWQSRLKKCVVKLNAKWRGNLVECEQCGRNRTTNNGRCRHCTKRLSPESLWRIRRNVAEWLFRSQKKCRECDQRAEWHSSLCPTCASNRDRQRAKQTGHKARCRKHGSEYRAGIKLRHVLARDGACCSYCGIRTTRHIHNADTQAEIDHVIPISKGGGHVMENLVVACRKCNNKKSDKIVTLW